MPNDRDDGLFLYEEAVLLALRDDLGSTEFGAWYHQAVGGAVLADLLLGGWLGVEDGPKDKLMAVVADASATGSDLLDECRDRVSESKKPRTLEEWVRSFAGVRELKHKAPARLVRMGVLTEDKDTVLFVFPRTRYPERDGGPEDEVKARLREVIMGDSTDIDARTGALVALAHHANLLRNVLEKSELKARKDRIKLLASGDLIGDATASAVQAAQAAIMVACMTPAVTAAVIS